MTDYNEPISDAGHVVGDGLVQRIADLERLVERLRVDAKDTAIALARQAGEVERLREALKLTATECSTFPIKEGLAFRCESIARAALEAKP